MSLLVTEDDRKRVLPSDTGQMMYQVPGPGVVQVSNFIQLYFWVEG